MKRLLKILCVIILTIVSQVGGLIFLLNEALFRKCKVAVFWKWISFLALYTIFTFMIIPYLAPFFGREKVMYSKQLTVVNYSTVVFNRNYVTPELNEILIQTSKRLEGTGIKISHLDANFPFINSFPLLPHLSHKDGRKIDISLIYEHEDGKISALQKSRSGYGVFEEALNYEQNQNKRCLESGYFQYDYPKYFTLGRINDELKFSKSGTNTLITALLESKKVKKVFLEPHLKTRLELKDDRIRYQGCHSVRHDDHIHIQI